MDDQANARMGEALNRRLDGSARAIGGGVLETDVQRDTTDYRMETDGAAGLEAAQQQRDREFDAGMASGQRDDTIKGNPERSVFEDKGRIFNALSEAQCENEHLKAQIARLQPKANAYDLIERMWRDTRDAEGAWGVDRTWENRHLLERMSRELSAEKQAAYEARREHDIARESDRVARNEKQPAEPISD